MKRLLVVHHTVSPATHNLLTAALDGARDPAIVGVEVTTAAALSASAADVLHADGYLILSPANLGYLAGAMKHFFDVVYYPCLESTRRRPFAAVIHSNEDASGALRALRSITTGLGWTPAGEPLVVSGAPGREELAFARESGAIVAAGLMLHE